MTELIIYGFCQGFGIALLLYFTGYIVPLIQSLTCWRG